MVQTQQAVRKRRAIRELRFQRLYRPWPELPADLQEAVLDLIAEPYLRLGYPDDRSFATAHNVTVGTAGFRAVWAEEIARRKDAHRVAYSQGGALYLLYVRRDDGRPVALATMLAIHSTRDCLLNDAPGDLESHLPTLRMMWFRWGDDADFPIGSLTERKIVELARMCVCQTPRLTALVLDGTLTLAEAAYVEAHGFDETYAMAYWCDQARVMTTVAYLGNTQSWLMSALERRGLDVRRPYRHAGAEPTAHILGQKQSTSAYFVRGRAALADVVPPHVIAEGSAKSIRYLIESNFDGWDNLSLSLPYLVLDNVKTRLAMAQLLARCGLGETLGAAVLTTLEGQR